MKFIRNTRYYRDTVYEWNLPSGFSCPFAKECLVKVDRVTGKFSNKSNAYKCYSAMAERFPSCRESRWKNYDYVKGGGIPVLPAKARAVRIHSSGDFYNQDYFDMWLQICRDNPEVEFWAYTKSLPYWTKRINEIPDNLVLTASYGGRFDHLIEQYGLKYTKVIKSKKEALFLPIDYNDDEARKPKVNFYLLDNFKPK